MIKRIGVLLMTVMALSSCGDKLANNPLVNPAQTPFGAPEFSKIEVAHYEPAFDYAIEQARAEYDAIINNPEAPTFENTIEAMERGGELLNNVAGIFYALNECLATEEMQLVAERIQPKMTAFSNDINLNPDLFARVEAVWNARESLSLNPAQSKLLEDTYKGFVRGGAALDEEKKARYRELSTELSGLTLKYGQNVLSATNAFAINITDEAVVAELPDFVKDAMASEAKGRGEEGWTVSLQQSSMSPFLTYSTNRELKEKVWRAYNSRALGGEFDNGPVMQRIAAVRMEIANIFGYPTYADYVLEERMAESRATVDNFLNELLTATKAYADKDYQTIVDYAYKSGVYSEPFEFMPWDFAYFSEKYKNEKYSFNAEEVKPYLELESVKQGIFTLAGRLYGITFTENTDLDKYHPEVTIYEVREADGELLGLLYMDFFPRSTKRAGAWMTNFREMYYNAEGEVRPLVTMCCNFTKPTETSPSLLTFDEFETFLHEFGHCLHGLFASGQYSSQSGTNVFRDFVELPSQIMENWATESEFLDLFAKHYQTGEKMPAELIEKIIAAGNFQAAYANVRQVAYGMVDMAWHTITEPVTENVEAFEKRAMAPTQVLPLVDGSAMTTAFTHIFSGGYAAGYYSYKWAEVLEADAFAMFEENGIFDKATAQSFRDNVLSKGSTEHPMKLYVNFRGHEPQVDALINKILR